MNLHASITGVFGSTLDIIPDRDWMSSRAPELYVYIRIDLPETEIRSKIKILLIELKNIHKGIKNRDSKLI